MKRQKTFEFEITRKSDDGGQIVINTSSVDRDRDRVFPAGGRVDDYLRNPVVQFGHNYRDPWATVGKTTKLKLTKSAIKANFELRPAANDHDPQNIVRLLWAGEWIRTASIGFMPDFEQIEENEFGGFDFKIWDLLEWSLVPIPANQDALRMAIKSMGAADILERWPVKIGDDQILRMAPDATESDPVPNLDGTRSRKFYVIGLAADADPDLVIRVVDNDDDDPNEPGADDGRGAGETTETKTGADDNETDIDPPSGNNEPNIDPTNPDDVDETELVHALTALADTLQDI